MDGGSKRNFNFVGPIFYLLNLLEKRSSVFDSG